MFWTSELTAAEVKGSCVFKAKAHGSYTTLETHSIDGQIDIDKDVHKHPSICSFGGGRKTLSFRFCTCSEGAHQMLLRILTPQRTQIIKRPVGFKNKIQGMTQFREDLELHTLAIIIRMYSRNFTWLPIHITDK